MKTVGDARDGNDNVTFRLTKYISIHEVIHKENKQK